MLESFVEELKTAREKAGISLQQVAAKTRIDIKFLEALEKGDFNFLPELYVKAFIKQYSKVVGLDEEETVEKFVMAKEGKQQPVETEKPVDSEINKEGVTEKLTPEAKLKKPFYSYTDKNARKKDGAEKKKKQNLILIGGYGLGVFILAILFYFLFIHKSDDIIVEEKPYDEVLQETPKRYVEEKSDKTTEHLLPSNIGELTLTIVNVDSVDSAWVLVVMDDTTQTDFLLTPKISKTVKANKSFNFTLGNSGAVKLLLNNSEIEFEGRRGAVRHFKLDSKGLERIYAPPQISRE